MVAELSTQIEGVLFFKAAPVKKRLLSELLGVSAAELEAGLAALRERLTVGATRLVETEAAVELMTAPVLDETIEGLRKDELKRDIGRAGAETLAIILYRGPLSRSEIDRIRGVNSSFILRSLMMRGLVERTNQGKHHHYQATTALLAHVGISRREELPEFKEIMDALDAYESQQESQSI